MKKTIFYSLFSALFMLTSCSMFEIDNYEEPAETIWGEVVDEATGKRVLTDQGSEGIRVRLTELSWGDNVQHNPDFYCMMTVHSRTRSSSKVSIMSVSTARSFH